MNILILMTARK